MQSVKRYLEAVLKEESDEDEEQMVDVEEVQHSIENDLPRLVDALLEQAYVNL